MIFVHCPCDTHQDHRHLAEAVTTAARNEHCVLYYEGITTGSFNPKIMVDITAHMETKERMLKAHESQMLKVVKNTHETTLLHFADSLALFRGAQARVKYAEAFDVNRFVLNKVITGW
jgi:LmbE family N-acetylglucosaminyl deacetylase